MHCLQDEATGF